MFRLLGSAAPKVAGRLSRALIPVENHLIEIERRSSIAAPWSVSASRFTAGDNRIWWNSHDWSRYGEEWTPSAEWKAAILERFLKPYLSSGGSMLEIGPGAGRWTDILRNIAAALYVLDVASYPLSLCRDRFVSQRNVVYILGDGRNIPLADRSLDGIWSYDVFVHVNPVDARNYVGEFARVLRPGSYAVIHHPGNGSTVQRMGQHRSDLTDEMIRCFAAENRLQIVIQTAELVNVGDVLTVLCKPPVS